MRYLEKAIQPEKKPKEEKKEPAIKAGDKDYDYSNLSNTKTILTGRGSL